MKNDNLKFKFIFLSILFIAFFGMAKSSKAAVLFEENFNSQPNWTVQQSSNQSSTAISPDASVPSGFYDYRSDPSLFGEDPVIGDGIGQNNLNIDSLDAYGGTGKSYRVVDESADDTWCGPNVWCNDSLLGISLVGTNWTQGYDEVFIRYDVKFQDGFQWRVSDTDPYSSIKFLHASHYDGTEFRRWSFHNDYNAPSFVTNLSVSSNPYNNRVQYGYGGRCYDAGGGYDAVRSWAYTDGSGQDVQNGGCVWNAPGCIRDDTWFRFEYRLKMNSSPSATDGIAKVWLDGVLIVDENNLNWTTSDPATRRWNSVWIGGNTWNNWTARANMAEQYRAFDNFVVYTPLVAGDPLWSASPQDGRLPQNYAISGTDTTAPSAPTGLSVN
jgi:hypothetical protein